jgi:hypothetical protein
MPAHRLAAGRDEPSVDALAGALETVARLNAAHAACEVPSASDLALGRVIDDVITAIAEAPSRDADQLARKLEVVGRNGLPRHEADRRRIAVALIRDLSSILLARSA